MTRFRNLFVGAVLVLCASHTVARAAQLDVLVVMDVSTSAREERQSVSDHIDRFLAELDDLPGGLPDLHVGVITSDLGTFPSTYCSGPGDRGLLQNTASSAQCTGPMGTFIIDESDGAGGRARNYDAGQGLSGTFACIASLPSDGCVFLQPLEAVRLALDPATTWNNGFQRPGATLAILFVTDDDDCSASDPRLFDANDPEFRLDPTFRCTARGVVCGDPATAPSTPGSYSGCRAEPAGTWLSHPDHFRDALLAAVGGDSQRLVLGALIGPRTPFAVSQDTNTVTHLDPSCTGALGPAKPPVRLGQLLDAFPGSVEVSLCAAADAGDGLAAFGAAVRAHLLAGPSPDAGVEPPADEPGGCCDAGASDARGAIILALVVGLALAIRQLAARTKRSVSARPNDVGSGT